MKAAILRQGEMIVDEISTPQPGVGQALVKTLACGICGSDLHMKQHGPGFVQAMGDGSLSRMDFAQDIVMGHEYCAEVAEFGPDMKRDFNIGDRVCSLPVVFDRSGRSTVGYSNIYPGGFGEYMILSEALLLHVPNGLTADAAAMTEPMAVGEHAVVKAMLEGVEKPLVIGCGPVGLAVIAALKRRGIGPVTAADFSPARRRLAETMGADTILDPAEVSPYQSWAEMTGLPVEDRGLRTGPAGVIFECVGVPGIIDQIIKAAPVDTRIMVVGVCLQEDRIFPARAIVKEINLQFVLGYSPKEFAQTLRHIAEGQIDVAPMLTGAVDLDGVAAAFDSLASPEKHAKIMVAPGSEMRDI